MLNCQMPRHQAACNSKRSQQGGEAVYPLPRIKSVEVHSKLNLAALLFANMTVGVENRKNRAVYTREGRKQLFAVLQSARGSSASVLKEKLSSLGSSGILADHQLQAQLQEQHLKGQSQLTISDIARKAFLYSHFMEEHARSSPISRLPLITILDTKHVLKDVPVCQPFHLELNFFNRENRVLHYPVRAFYLDGANLMAYNLCSGVDNVYKKLYTSIPGNVEFHPKYLLYSTKQHLFLVVYEFSGATTEVVLYWENTDSQSANSKTNTVKGLDAAFIGPNENQFAILDEDKTGLALYILPGGASLEVDKKNVADEQSQSADVNVGSVKGPLQFLFETEVDRIFSTPIESTLIFASHGDHVWPGKACSGLPIIKWLAGKRLFEAMLQESLLWVGPALLFSTTTAISMLGWDGKVRTILSISMPTAGLTALRISPRSLDILARGSPVCGDLAVSLSQAGPQFTQVLRGIYAINALRFSTALSVLKDEFLRSRDYPQCPPTSHLFHRFRQLGYACIKYGQFDSAKETFEVIADYESMLDLFICHLNPSAMRRLAQKLEEESADSELRRYCERILRVRSTGWTQGIFANFAAESMVPKGPEWGGGNWEIKTPTNLKSIPQWELATEVMPYMRTDDGSIPSILTDHIGVYLGLIKGRSNVVEVREGSLVKALKSDDMGMKANGLQAPLATSMSNNAKGVGDGSSLMGLETLTKQLTGPTAADEQAKAEEEFKKSLYSNADGSSSDEEGTSKAKKIHIRIRDKPVASATVDVNKIKEATKQFKLGEGLGLPMSRTKPSTGQSPDLGLIVPQPAPTITGSMTAPTVSAPADIFGTDSMVQPAPVSQPGPVIVGGVATGPIPEDFFQNTISSVKVAALLPPPGTYLSRMDQNSQGFESSKVAPKQLGVPVADVGLPDGGIPPQVTQSPVSLDSIGLPDGGVPPQPVAQLSALPASQVQTAQVTVSTQPIDLSSLEPPGSVNSGKPSARPDSPKSVRPGQVPRGAAASVCFKTGLAHLEQNQLPDALSCFDEAFLALAKDQSRGSDIRAQATICAQYKIAVTLLQEIGRLQRVQGPSAISAKDEMARLSRHLGSLPLLAKHRINCIRTAIKRNMERGSSNKSIDPLEDPSQFCAATLSRLSTIGYDVCDLCGAKFSALSTPGCIICGMGSIKRSDSLAVPVPSPFG
ncbi:transducin/WD40 repeat-like superfamily protein [Actinidia rufa]|uniref:Transducin/WD40 repeat-like superfamily protein n=1 Tax=Actinidia rufa TaxID=165716 RepID=A0A7J0F543_9ERIC|nr:transducin/WD40 repeat-like superfamily protein [Actinidia rufa]